MSDLRLLHKITKVYRKSLLDPSEADYFERKQLRAISEESNLPGVMAVKRAHTFLLSIVI